MIKTIEEEFTILTYMGEYVDCSLLFTGIYSAKTPYLYSKETTIASLKKWAMDVAFAIEGNEGLNNYLENIDKCEIVTVRLKMM